MGENLRTYCIKNNLEYLLEQWHPTKNGDLKPEDVAANSHKKVYWYLPYDDSKTGKHFDFEWTAMIADRAKGIGCPYLSGQAVWQGFNDLATTHPELTKEWHPTKNGDLKPTDVTAGCNKKVYWFLPYDDPNTGKHHEFEWEARIVNRVKKMGCPYLSGRAVWQGFNDLATTHPELTKEWHPTKNGDLKPTDVTAGCNKKVYWFLPYDDPNTGKHHEFEWEDTIINRSNGRGCPYISGRKVWVGFNDLATTNPRLAAEWHPTKNGNLKPTDVTAGCNKKVYWVLPYDDPDTGKHHEFEWEAGIVDRTFGNGCPYLSGRAVWQGFNDLATTHPEIAKEWHPMKNRNLKPTDVTAGCNKKVYWVCPIGHIYKSAISGRTYNNNNCSTCTKESRTSFPEQAIYYYIKQVFHDAMNGNTEILDSKKELDIYIPSIHTAIEYDGERWHKNIQKDITKNCECANKKLFLIRIREESCPNMEENTHLKIIKCVKNDMDSLSKAIHKIGKLLDTKFDVDIKRDQTAIYSQYVTRIKKNSLAVKYPEVAKEWNYKRNGNLTPEMVNYGSHMKVWWLLPYDDPNTGKHHDFEWPAMITDRTKGIGYPYLSGMAVWPGFNDLTTTHPEIAAEWHPTMNGHLTPSDVTLGSKKEVWWINSKGEAWKEKIYKRTSKTKKDKQKNI